MTVRFVFAIVLLAAAAPGQNTKDQLKEVQRDISLMQDQMRQWQTQQSEKLGALQALIQQAVDSANKANGAVLSLQSALSQNLGEQSKSVGNTVTSMGMKVDTMADEFRGVKESIADLSARMAKLDAKMTDLNNVVRAVNQPVAAPPSGPGTSPLTQGSTGGGPMPSASATYENALRDYNGGKFDLAMQEFQDYLKYFPKTELAPNAQFYIGEIYLRGGDSDNAVKAYDAVLENYPENNKTPDAHYMKAKAYFQAGQRTKSAQEYCDVIKRYPDADVAGRAKSALKGMGFTSTCGVTAAPSATRRKKR